MHIFEGENINSLYIDIIKAIMYEGEEITKNGRKIKELFPCLIRIHNPKEGILLSEGRHYNPAFLTAETIWNLAGDSDNWICNYNKLYHSYFTDEKLKAGYGNRIFNWDSTTNQFELVSKRLIEEPHTQHADITIFNPTYDLKNPKFVPCITKLKFRIRNNKLFMTSFMRAQDMWLGFPYDINLLLSLFQLMSNRLKIEMGEYNHYCDVLRVYESNYQDVAKLTPHFSNASKDIDFNGICDFEKIKHYRDLIKNLPDNILEIIKDEPEYWKNGIKACYAYKLIQEKKYEQAHQVIDSITNGLKEQFEIWASYYHHFFFEIAN